MYSNEESLLFSRARFIAKRPDCGDSFSSKFIVVTKVNLFSVS